VEEVIVREHLEDALKSSRKLRVKFGIDPTAPALHLGHTVPLRKLRQLQDAGHQAVLIIGDFTATVGDPSGRSDTRSALTAAAVRANMKKYLEQAGRVIDLAKTEVRYNSEWYKKAEIAFLYDLLSKMTVQRALERDDFQKRLAQGRDLSIIELVYPLLQGYDSVAVAADVELGGTDQKFNLLAGRKIQRRFGMDEQDVMTVPLLEGTDGVRKMSKSTGNYIALAAPPDEMFGGVMAVPDTLMEKYFTLLTDTPAGEIADMRRDMDALAVNPRDIKMLLAGRIVAAYHGFRAAAAAREKFISVFSRRELPDEMPEIRLRHAEWTAVDLLTAAKLASSRSEARDLINQGAVRVDEKTITLGQVVIKKGTVIRVGKRRFVRVV
jgi:tyrosyl-tRNA synthetase